jgi:hypothetical protein
VWIEKTATAKAKGVAILREFVHHEIDDCLLTMKVHRHCLAEAPELGVWSVNSDPVGMALHNVRNGPDRILAPGFWRQW